MNLSPGETSQTSKTFCKFNNKKHFASLQNKVHFTCSLDLNSHYNEYLRQVKTLKMKKMLLTKFGFKLNNIQIEKIKKEIDRSEELLNLLSNHDTSNVKAETPVEVNDKIFSNKEEKKIHEIIESENIILNNLSKKGIIKAKTSLSTLSSRRVLAVNKMTGEVTSVLPKNIVSLLQLQSSRSRAKTSPVIDSLLAINDENKKETSRIICQSLDPKSGPVMALKVPIDEIIETNHVIDMKSEI